MSTTGLTSFDRIVQRANEWLNDLMDDLSTEDRRRAHLTLRSILR